MKPIVVGGVGCKYGWSFAGVLLWAVLAITSATQAAAVEYSHEDVMACTEDAFRFCASLIPDEPAIEACLDKQARRHKLSAACAARFTADAKH
jgi:hypothetical protein